MALLIYSPFITTRLGMGLPLISLPVVPHKLYLNHYPPFVQRQRNEMSLFHYLLRLLLPTQFFFGIEISGYGGESGIDLFARKSVMYVTVCGNNSLIFMKDLLFAVINNRFLT